MDKRRREIKSVLKLNVSYHHLLLRVQKTILKSHERMTSVLQIDHYNYIVLYMFALGIVAIALVYCEKTEETLNSNDLV